MKWQVLGASVLYLSLAGCGKQANHGQEPIAIKAAPSESTPPPYVPSPTPTHYQPNSLQHPPKVTITKLPSQNRQFPNNFKLVFEDEDGDLLLYQTFVDGVELPKSPLIPVFMGGPVGAILEEMNKPRAKMEEEFGFQRLPKGKHTLEIIVKDEKRNEGHSTCVFYEGTRI